MIGPRATVSLLIFTLALGACRRGQVAPTPRDATPAARRPAAPPPELAQAAQAALKACEVTDYGSLRRCKPEVERALAAAEQRVGASQSLRLYCLAMGDKDHRLRALAAGRLSRFAFYKTMQEAGDEATLACLLDVLPRVRPAHLARPVARAATHLATALRKEEALLKLLEAATPEVKATAYEALWANGRLRLIDRLEALIKKERAPELRTALVMGFAYGGRLEEPEQKRVCVLLASLLTDAETRVASSAAVRGAELCPELKDPLLQAAEALVQQRRFDLAYVSALRGLNGFFTASSTPEQRRRSVALLSSIVAEERFADPVRAASLRTLAALDRAAGLKLAKQHAKAGGVQLHAAASAVTRRSK
jgi:hypothetical protein